MQGWKMQDWNYRHQTAGVENAGPSSNGKPKHLRDWNCRSYLDFYFQLSSNGFNSQLLNGGDAGRVSAFQAMVGKHLFDKIRLPTQWFSVCQPCRT